MDKIVYIKTEPGGKIAFGKLSETDEIIFEKSKINGSLSNDISYKLKRGISPYCLAFGVANYGNTNDVGNEGLIQLNPQIFEIPSSDNNLISGFYALYMSLSKVSIEFKIADRSSLPYDSNKLTEVSTRMNFPKCIKHQTYDDLNFNIVTDYLYDGKLVKNANKGMIDRGFDEAIYILSVENNQIKLVYENLGSGEFFF
jgi:hypothetical protein